MSKKIPEWLSDITADSLTVKLARPTEINGIKQNRITLRVPTIGDVRAASKQNPDDKEGQEITLFASLAGCSPSDIERLTVKDYGRVQEGYFRLVADQDDTGGTEAAGQTAGG